MKGKNNIWKRWWLGLAYLSLPLYRNHSIDYLHMSVNGFEKFRKMGLEIYQLDPAEFWFLYNGNTGLNCKVDAWLR